MCYQPWILINTFDSQKTETWPCNIILLWSYCITKITGIMVKNGKQWTDHAKFRNLSQINTYHMACHWPIMFWCFQHPVTQPKNQCTGIFRNVWFSGQHLMPDTNFGMLYCFRFTLINHMLTVFKIDVLVIVWGY